jgi:2-haloacid dehalogenase
MIKKQLCGETMLPVLAFDVYGTLINTHGVVEQLETIVGSRAEEFSRIWREKQLEYSFRRGLMQQYQNFAVCTRDALDYTCLSFKTLLSEAQKKTLLTRYRNLPAYDDVVPGLMALEEYSVNAFAFSNGDRSSVESLLSNARLNRYLKGIISVDDVKTFKPSPLVYEYLLKTTASNKANTWLVSSNPFDVIGAIAFGLKAIWVQRTQNSIFDPWGIKPTATVNDLTEIKDIII